MTLGNALKPDCADLPVPEAGARLKPERADMRA
jgi:hypothetical protein